MRTAKPFMLFVLIALAVLGTIFNDSIGWEVSTGAPTEYSLTSLYRNDKPVRLIGPIASVAEQATGLVFNARVDTGASRCSLHVAEWEIENEEPSMPANVGKRIRFRLVNRQGESKWLSRHIAMVDMVRTPDHEEMRYLVPLSFSLGGVEREVLVSLNDRSRMDYAMLLGRNFLEGEFVVDVSRNEAAESLIAANP